MSTTADEAVSVEHRPRGPKPTVRDEAKDWLQTFLANGPKLATDVYDAAKVLGFAERTIRRAREALGVNKAVQGFQGPWLWTLPGSGLPANPGDEG